MKQFKIRCSAIGKIMGKPRKKGEVLSETAKTYCKDWLKEQLYERRKFITSKYMDKGNIMEDNSLDLIAEELGYGMLIKNEEFFENDFCKGTPDAILNDHLIDVKNSWDFTTFPLFDEEIPNKDYYWQGIGYMALTGRDSYKLIYTLMDTPESIIEKEFKWNNPLEKEYEEFKKYYLYNSVKINLRIKTFEFEQDEEAVQLIAEKVQQCREYISELIININK